MKLFVPAVASIALSAASLSALAMHDSDYYGEAVSPAAAERTIVVGPNTRAVAVKKGEIVKIVANGQEFAWDFDGTLPYFKLKQIAPPDVMVPDVSVYVAPPADAASGV